MKRIAVLGAVVVALALVPLGARAQEVPVGSGGAGPAGVLAADAQSYAMRVEYNLPVPAGTGTIGQANASVGRSVSGGESAHGVAGAPTQLDPVVGGRFADPFQTGHPEQRMPHAECYHPGDLVDVEFTFPSDVRPETAATPPLSYAAAVCGAGPSVRLESRTGPDAVAGDAAPISVTATSSSSGLGPGNDTLRSVTQSTASGISFAGGAIRIGSVTASGASSTRGTAGSATTMASIAINDIEIAGTQFSIASAETDGEPSLVLSIGPLAVPIDSAVAQGVLATVNTALVATGCTITIASDPARYPQGFLFARPQPALGVEEDGSLAASYRGGLLVVCDIPENPVSAATEFNPERFQALVGFVFTSVSATGDVGGFGVGNLGGTGVPTIGLTPVFPVATPLVPAVPALDPDRGPPAVAAPTERAAPTVRITRFAELDPTVRWLLGIGCVVVWAALTHLGIKRLWLLPARRGSGA